MTGHRNNISPFLWGPCMWASINNTIASLPEELFKKEIDDTMCLFKSLSTALPCASCRLSYIQYSKEHDTDIHDVENFRTKDSIISLTHGLREKVNKKLELEYCISINYFTLKLNHLICDDKNRFSFIVSELKDAPFIQECIMKQVLSYLQKNSNYNITKICTLIDTLKIFLKHIKKKDFDLNNPTFKLLTKRNNKCLKYKNQINKNKILYDYNIVQSFVKDNSLYHKLFSLGCNFLGITDTRRLIGF